MHFTPFLGGYIDLSVSVQCVQQFPWYHVVWFNKMTGPFSISLIFANSLKEYEIITLIYNRKSCRLDLLYFCAPEDIFL